MEVNLKRPFSIIKEARDSKSKSNVSCGKKLRKKVKQENSPIIDKASTKVSDSVSKLINFPIFKESEPEKYIIQKPFPIPQYEVPNPMIYLNNEADFNINWSQRGIGNELKFILANQSFDTQSSLSCGSYLEENLKKVCQNPLDIVKYSNLINEKINENWNEDLSLIESDDQSSNDFMNLDGVCSKEIKKFPIPFDKEIINFIENEEF